VDRDGWTVRIFDQTKLPWALEALRLADEEQAAHAIRSMQVRGAPLIGAVAAYGVALALRRDPSTASLDAAVGMLGRTRPTAVNLAWALGRMRAALHNLAPGERVAAAYAEAAAIADDDAETCRRIGAHGLPLLRGIAEAKPAGGAVNVLTHCNAGWLATVEWGTALGVVTVLHERGLVERVYADETRPLLQGARLTAYELAALGVDHRVVVDGAAPSLIARGLVDAVVVGADRIAANGDVANKVGTYPLALAAARAGLPFVVAAPESTVDAATATGAEIEIEERDPREVSAGPAYNPAFDVTPADLVTAVVTERRTVRPSEGETL
jgi:methylthioribose-1-phosphate isomerase